MDIKRNLSNCLRAMYESREGSLQEFADELNIPRSTLQSVLAEGNTTMETLMRISESTGIPPDLLLADDSLPGKLGVARWLLRGLNRFDALEAPKQQKLADHINGILEVVVDDRDQADTADRAYI